MESDAAHILVVEDDDRIRDLVTKYLSDYGFLVIPATDAADARRKLQSLVFDLIVLDLMMPGETGLEFARALRANGENVPILMLTAMSETGDRIEGLESGADDYLTKPFEPRELLLRINAILKRAAAAPTSPPLTEVRMGDCLFDMERAELIQDGQPVRLTQVEAVLLKTLAEHPGRAFSREDLIERTGGDAAGRAVDVQVTRLRRKIEPDPKLPRYLQTVRGKGYVLMPD